MPMISARAALLLAGLSGAALLAGASPVLAQAFPTDHTGDAAEGGMSRAQALGALMGKGYSNVGQLKGSKGTWTGEATKGGATQFVTVDKDGKITAVKQ
ncbi:MAG: hypothetical protein ACRYGC_10160 [Janthinobacterium lividum]